MKDDSGFQELSLLLKGRKEGRELIIDDDVRKMFLFVRVKQTFQGVTLPRSHLRGLKMGGFESGLIEINGCNSCKYEYTKLSYTPKDPRIGIHAHKISKQQYTLFSAKR
jgi:hypothetical protein